MSSIVIRLVVTAVFCAGLYFALRAMSSRGALRSRGPLTVVARQRLDRDASVAVVTIGDNALVLGVTAHQVTVLSTMTADELLTISTPIPADELHAALTDDAAAPDGTSGRVPFRNALKMSIKQKVS
jgi:flagellar biogenesis protein FliO